MVININLFLLSSFHNFVLEKCFYNRIHFRAHIGPWPLDVTYMHAWVWEDGNILIMWRKVELDKGMHPYVTKGHLTKMY